MNSFFSIITTVKNGGCFIKDTLESVRNQSYSCFEHIIIDDGSEDNTQSILQAYNEAYPNYPLKVFTNKKHGRGRALNLGISKANGNWIAILDADDLWHPEKLKIQNQIIKNLKEEVDVVATASISFTEENFELSQNLTVNYSVLPLAEFLVKNAVCHSSAVIKKEKCKYDVTRKSQFDIELWLRLIYGGGRIIRTTSVLTYHRLHHNQSFESKLGWRMSYNSFKLKAVYCIKAKKPHLLIKNVIFLLYTLLIPRHKRVKGLQI